MRLDSSSRLGIGSDGTNAPLHVVNETTSDMENFKDENSSANAYVLDLKQTEQVML